MPGENDKLEVYKDKRGDFRWRRIAPNGKVVGASTEGYRAKADCEANMTRGPVATDSWEFYEDRRGQHRWRRRARNGQIVGASCEGYATRADAVANARRQGYED
jgi:uncharacterized protein YegP (UPF0339 family)